VRRRQRLVADHDRLTPVAKRKGRPEPKHARAVGFLVDENTPAEVSEWIAARGYRVAHIGRSGPHLIDAPPKGTPDARLKPAVAELIFVTQDRRLLRAGAFPADHRGVFVLDAENAGALELVQELFQNTDWKKDPYVARRRFIVRRGKLVEVESDGTESTRWW
jgi:hypothetical protein